MGPVRYATADVDGFNVFYREAGNRAGRKLLLLHGFPSASHMFRELIPLLADRFHVVAPDLPGFGQSDMPRHDQFDYTFDNLARIIERFADVVGFDQFAVYVFDYGAPTGFRLAAHQPDRITAIISQNGNAYEEGLSDELDPDPGLLGRPVIGESQRTPILPLGRDDPLAVHARRARSFDRLS